MYLQYREIMEPVLSKVVAQKVKDMRDGGLSYRGVAERCAPWTGSPHWHNQTIGEEWCILAAEVLGIERFDE